jgi:aminoglycoside phosphotransferase (APT) family kinase protein
MNHVRGCCQDGAMTEVALSGGGSTVVTRRGDVVLRQGRPWSQDVFEVLRQLPGIAPRPLGFAEDGREMLTYVEGETAPVCWSPAAANEVGRILRQVHAVPIPPGDRTWMPWWGRNLPGGDIVLGHCDAAPWNFLAQRGLPVALLDWDTAGPVPRRWDVAQTAWLNCQLHDDDVAAKIGLPNINARAALLQAFATGYGLTPGQRSTLVSDMIEVATRTSAQEAIDAGVHEEGTSPAPMGLLGGGPPFEGAILVWAITWRVRSARWMLEHRSALESSVQ